MYQECKLGKCRTYSQVKGDFVPNLKEYYVHPHRYYIAPFKIFGNLYYVGDKKICCHLIDTGDGLILFDTGYRNASHQLLQSIYEMGFNPKDIKYIVHTHGHFDHMGAGDEFRDMFGCKVFMSAVDTQLLRERPDRALLDWGPMKFDEICWPDVEINDGDHIKLGNTDIRCVLTPGHTLGTMTFFFDVTEGDTTCHVGYMGGAGFLTIYREYCKEFGIEEDKCAHMFKSIDKLWNEKVDIVLGNHPNQNCSIEKRQHMIENPGSNPFINPLSWRIFLTELKTKLTQFVEEGYADSL